MNSIPITIMSTSTITRRFIGRWALALNVFRPWPVGSAACSLRPSELEQPRNLSGLVASDVICFNRRTHGPVAQRLEQGTHNPLVPGSNPGGPRNQRSEIRSQKSETRNQPSAPIWISESAAVHRFRRVVLAAIEIAILSALILATRCANHQDVFVAGNVYFTDADCYARMTRVRMCAEHPGLVVRHHDFENYPAGTTPHTTAPLDYLILALWAPLRPFSARSLDLTGALVSPLLALVAGWFLWWWSKRMRFRYRWAGLILYAISPILVHGTELGRPDHQSLLLLLVAVAICAEWGWQTEASTGWSVLSGIAWSLSIWVSAYEPLFLLVLLLAGRAVASPKWMLGLFQGRRFGSAELPPAHPSRFGGGANAVAATKLSSRKDRRVGWIVFAAIIALAVLIERRVPQFSIFASGAIFRNWARTIGELRPVSPLSSTWFRWAGYAIVIAPVLIWLQRRRLFLSTTVGHVPSGSAEQGGTAPGSRALPMVVGLLLATYGLTIWQARWGYFFILIFAIALPALVDPIKSAGIIWMAFTLSIFPILREWDGKIWPSDSEMARRIESRNESVQLRDLSISLKSREVRAFLAPWWLSPSIAYWSGEPGVAGSSHESLDGIADSARFFLAEDVQKARQIVENRKVSWVVAYDADRTAAISALILNESASEHALCYILERAPARAPRFLTFAAQNATARLFRVTSVANSP
jgi:hypothetical protein